jgi:hypothetical protein
MEYASASSFFGEEKVVKFPYRPEERLHGERTIAVRLLAPGGGPAPDLDVNTVEITNPTGRLVILDRSLQADCVVIRCKVDPNFVALPDFNDKVRFEFTLRIEAKSKTPIRGKFPKFAGLFKAKIDPILVLHWMAALLDEPGLITSDRDKRPMVLPPDGSAGMRIRVWAEELSGGRWVARPGEYEFTHRMAPGNPDIDFRIVKMAPPPEAIGGGDLHEDTYWYSVAALPNKQTFPQFAWLPVDFEIRVLAYRKGIIRHHVRDATPVFFPGKDEPNLAEILIPIQLQHEYELEFEVYLKGDPDKIGSFTRRVNGEKVTVNCPALPRYADATLRWRVTGPARIFKTKKKFFTDWQTPS